MTFFKTKQREEKQRAEVLKIGHHTKGSGRGTPRHGPL